MKILYRLGLQVSANKASQLKLFTTKLHDHLRVDGLDKIQSDENEQQRIISREQTNFRKWKKFIDSSYREWQGHFKNKSYEPIAEEGEELGDYYYFNKFDHAKGYEVLYRKFKTSQFEEEVFDIGKVPFVSDSSKVSLKSLRISDDHKFGVYIIDMNNDENTVGGVFSVVSKEYFRAKIDNAHELEFGHDSNTIIKLKHDSNIRPYQVSALSLNYQRNSIDISSENILYEAKDKSQLIEIGRSKNGECIVINSLTNTDSELSLLNLKSMKLFTIFNRIKDVKFFVDISNNSIFILTNLSLDKPESEYPQSFRVYSVQLKVLQLSSLNSQLKLSSLEVAINPSQDDVFEDMQVFDQNVIVFAKNRMRPLIINYSLNTKKSSRVFVSNLVGEITPGINKVY